MKKKIFLLTIIFYVFLLTSCNNDSSITPMKSETTYKKDESKEETGTKNIDESVERQVAENKLIVDVKEYKGRIGNSDIKMSLNYYYDGTISGSYFYDKYKTDILIYGKKEFSTITLYNDEFNETFKGYINGGFISGDWQNSNNSENFVIWNENYDEFQTSFSQLQIDNKHLYYQNENSIYKSDFDGNNKTKIYENDNYYFGFIVYDEHIYFVNRQNKICRIDSNGQNEEVIVDDKASRFLIYKDKIYYITEDGGTNQLNTVDLMGNGHTKIDLPKFYHDNGDEKKFYLDSIYNDYVYFATYESAGSSIFRIKTDGTDSKEFDRFSNIIGFSDDKMIINNKTTEIFEVNTENFEEMEKVYDKVNLHLNADLDYYLATNNGNYIVMVYKTFEDDFYNLTVLTTDGEILNEMKLEIDNYFHIYIVNDYMYLIDDYDENVVSKIHIFEGQFEFMNRDSSLNTKDDSDLEITDTDFANMAIVNETLGNIRMSSYYVKSTPKERASIMTDALNDLIDKGLVIDGSVKLDENRYIGYEYSCGLSAGEMLVGFDPDKN